MKGSIMKARSKLSRHASRKMFTRNARKTDVKNISPRPMRGGIRL